MVGSSRLSCGISIIALSMNEFFSGYSKAPLQSPAVEHKRTHPSMDHAAKPFM